MELISVQRARTVWLSETGDMNPRGQSIGKELIDWLAESYHFAKVPSSILDLEKDSNALAFLSGQFKAREEFVAVELRMYRDGFVADTRSSTEDADAFLRDALDSAVKKFGLTFRPEMIRKILYLSELIVRCNRSISDLNPKLKSFSEKISSLAGMQSHPLFDVFGIAFWHDPQISSKVAQFRFERRANTPASENMYYSVAPLKTADHLSILNELEKILSA